MPKKVVSRFIVLAAISGLFVAGSATRTTAQEITGGELQCQLGTTLEVGKFVRDKSQCIENCYKKAFAAGTAPACSPPYSGSLGGCVTSEEASAQGQMQSKCAQDCPECYTGGNCQDDATARIADAEAAVDALAAQAFCDDSGSTNALTLNEFKCQRTVRKFITKFWASKLKCFAKCRKTEIGGKLAEGLSCDQPTNDPKTQECIAKAEGKTAFLIDKKCEASINPSADKPECAPYDTRTGADWVADAEAQVDARLPSLFCDDPTATTSTTLP